MPGKILSFLCLFIFFNAKITCAQNDDIELLRAINSSGNNSLDKTCKILSQSVTPIAISEPLAVFLYGVAKKDSLVKRKSYVIGASLLLAGIITTGLKYAVNRPRPFETYPFIVNKSKAGSPSFPSGHTSEAFSVAASLSFAFPKWYVITPSFLWAASVGYSRMELGVHYPSDVLAGAIIGTGSCWLAWKVNRWLASKKK